MDIKHYKGYRIVQEPRPFDGVCIWQGDAMLCHVIEGAHAAKERIDRWIKRDKQD